MIPEKEGQEMNTAHAAMEARDLTVGYDDKALLQHISLAIRPGTIVTLIGPNGTGKSTILKTLSRQLPAVDGVVYLNGQDMKNLGAAAIAQQLSIVMTERVHTNFMTCRDVVAAGRYPHTGRLGVLSKEDWKSVGEALRLVHAQDIADQDFMKISDGQRQRVMLARALCQKPRVLILDEPTSYLDMRYQLDLLDVIRYIARKDQIAVIMSLHELRLAQEVSDIILTISQEGSVQIGTPEQIFRTDQIRRLYQLPEDAYDAFTGSCFLPAVKGAPEVFVLGGGGSGIGTCYQLQREGIPFAAGIYMENDVEFATARALASQLVRVPAFTLPGDREISWARQLIDACRKVLAPIAQMELHYAAADELIAYAREQGKIKDRQ